MRVMAVTVAPPVVCAGVSAEMIALDDEGCVLLCSVNAEDVFVCFSFSGEFFSMWLAISPTAENEDAVTESTKVARDWEIEKVCVDELTSVNEDACESGVDEEKLLESEDISDSSPLTECVLSVNESLIEFMLCESSSLDLCVCDVILRAVIILLSSASSDEESGADSLSSAE